MSLREGAAAGGGGRGRALGCQVEEACAGKVNPGMVYNGLQGTPMISDEVFKLGLEDLQKH